MAVVGCAAIADTVCAGVVVPFTVWRFVVAARQKRTWRRARRPNNNNKITITTEKANYAVIADGSFEGRAGGNGRGMNKTQWERKISSNRSVWSFPPWLFTVCPSVRASERACVRASRGRLIKLGSPLLRSRPHYTRATATTGWGTTIGMAVRDPTPRSVANLAGVPSLPGTVFRRSSHAASPTVR